MTPTERYELYELYERLVKDKWTMTQIALTHGGSASTVAGVLYRGRNPEYEKERHQRRKRVDHLRVTEKIDTVKPASKKVTVPTLNFMRDYYTWNPNRCS